MVTVRMRARAAIEPLASTRNRTRLPSRPARTAPRRSVGRSASPGPTRPRACCQGAAARRVASRCRPGASGELVTTAPCEVRARERRPGAPSGVPVSGISSRRGRNDGPGVPARRSWRPCPCPAVARYSPASCSGASCSAERGDGTTSDSAVRSAVVSGPLDVGPPRPPPPPGDGGRSGSMSGSMSGSRSGSGPVGDSSACSCAASSNALVRASSSRPGASNGPRRQRCGRARRAARRTSSASTVSRPSQAASAIAVRATTTSARIPSTSNAAHTAVTWRSAESGSSTAGSRSRAVAIRAARAVSCTAQRAAKASGSAS